MALGIQEAFEGAFKSIVGLISDAVYSVFDMILQALIKLLTATPVPRLDAQFPPLAQPVKDCSIAGGPQCQMWSEIYHEVYLGGSQGIFASVIAIALFLFTISFVTGYVLNIYSTHSDSRGGDTSTFSGSAALGALNERYLYALIGIALWWPLGTGILYLSHIFTKTLASASAYTGQDPQVNAFSAAVGMIILLLASNALILIVVVFWILRYVLLLILMATMPILMAIWTMRVGPTKVLAETAGDLMNLFVTLAFAPIPAALVLLGGSFVTGSTIVNLAPGVGNGLAQALVTIIIDASVPLLASLVPLIMFKQSMDMNSTHISRKIGSKIDSATDRDKASKRLESAKSAGQKAGKAKRDLQNRDWSSAKEGAAKLATGGYAAAQNPRAFGEAVKKWDSETDYSEALSNSLDTVKDKTKSGFKNGAERLESSDSFAAQMTGSGINAAAASPKKISETYDEMGQAAAGITSAASTIKEKSDEEIYKAFAPDEAMEIVGDELGFVEGLTKDINKGNAMDQGHFADMSSLDMVGAGGSGGAATTTSFDAVAGYEPTSGEEDESTELTGQQEGMSKKEKQEYKQLRRLVASLENTNPDEIGDPVVRGVVDEFNSEELMGMPLKELQETDRQDVRDTLGKHVDSDVVDSEKFVDYAHNKDSDKMFETILKDVVGAEDDLYNMVSLDAKDAERVMMEESLEKFEGEEQIEDVISVINDDDRGDDEVFQTVLEDVAEMESERARAQIENLGSGIEAVRNELGESVARDVDNLIEKQNRGESFDTLSEAVKFDDNYDSVEDLVEDKVSSHSKELAEKLDADIDINDGEALQEFAENVSEKYVKGVEELVEREELTEITIEDMFEGEDGELDTDAIAEAFEGDLEDIVSTVDNENARENLKETLSDLSKTRFSDMAQKTVAALENASMEELDDTLQKNAKTQFDELEDLELEEINQEHKDATLNDINDELKDMTEEELENVAEAATGARNDRMKDVLKSLSVEGVDSRTRWEDEGE